MVNPVSLSADGKRNGFYHRCSIVGQSRPYAGCLARVDGGVNLDADCTTAIRQCNCPAMGMRQDEVVAGQAIFFQERNITPTTASRLWIESGGVERAKGYVKLFSSEGAPESSGKVTQAPGKPGIFSRMLDVGTAAISAAINKAASPVPAEPAPKQSQPSRPVNKLTLLPGESPIDAIRRMKAQPA